AASREQHTAAAAHFLRAIELVEARLGANSPKLAPLLRELGHVELARGARGPAARALERAAGLPAPAKPVAPEKLAEARFDLAQAIWPEDQPRALAEARAAARLLRD